MDYVRIWMCVAFVFVCDTTGQEIPVHGTAPKVLLSLTDHRTPDLDFSPRPRPNLVGDSLPTGDAHLAIATLDTGSSLVVVAADDTERFEIEGSGFVGRDQLAVDEQQSLFGTSSDPLGSFVAGFPANIETPLDPTQMSGIVNASVFYLGPSESSSSVGTPLLELYTTIVRNSDIRLVENSVSASFDSPAVELLPLGSVVTPDWSIPLRYQNSPFGDTMFLPDLTANHVPPFDFRNNPAFPTIGGNFFVQATLRQNDVEVVGEFLLATGSTTSFISTDVATQLAIDLEQDLEFEGTFEQSFRPIDAGGFYLDGLQFGTDDSGPLLENAPVFVFDSVIDSDATRFVDGVLGINVFNNFDLVINPEPENSYLGILPLGESLQRSCVLGNGDFDRDGSVTFADFLVLSDQFGQTGEYLQSDIDCDGSVTFADFLFLSESFQQEPMNARDFENVPEPTGFVVLALPCLALLAMTRRRRHAISF